MSARREIDKAIRHIIDWADRPEWADEKFEIYDRTILASAERMEMEAGELLQMLEERAQSGKASSSRPPPDIDPQESHGANRDGSVAYDFTWMWVELGLETQ